MRDQYQDRSSHKRSSQIARSQHESTLGSTQEPQVNDMTRPAYLKDILIEEIKQNPHITNRELAKILNVGTVYVSLLTKKLTDEGLITFSLNDNHVKEFEIKQT